MTWYLIFQEETRNLVAKLQGETLGSQRAQRYAYTISSGGPHTIRGIVNRFFCGEKYWEKILINANDQVLCEDSTRGCELPKPIQTLPKGTTIRFPDMDPIRPVCADGSMPDWPIPGRKE